MKKKASNFKLLPSQKIKILTTIRLLRYLIFLGRCIFLLACFLQRSPYTRKITLFFILSMHIGIALMMNLFIFSAMMIVLNITAWYDVVPFSKYIFNKKQAKIV